MQRRIYQQMGGRVGVEIFAISVFYADLVMLDQAQIWFREVYLKIF